MTKLSVTLLLLAALALLSGCGQKGDLFLPETQEDQEKSEQKENG